MKDFKPTSVKDHLKKKALDAKKRVKIFNPDTEPFTVVYNGEEFIIDSLEIAEYQYHIANHITKHLSTKLLNKRGIKSNAEDDLKKISKEIQV